MARDNIQVASVLVLRRYVVVLALVAGTVIPALALADAAPFGFAWGPLDKIPKPSLALRDANVTVLLYRRDRLQISDMDTEVVSLDVCKKEGLQQISWASKALPKDVATAKFVQVVAEAVQKYGESEPTPLGALAWASGRIEAISVSESDGMHRILMVSRGPDFDACSVEHDRTADQRLRTRWLRKIDVPN